MTPYFLSLTNETWTNKSQRTRFFPVPCYGFLVHSLNTLSFRFKWPGFLFFSPFSACYTSTPRFPSPKPSLPRPSGRHQIGIKLTKILFLSGISIRHIGFIHRTRISSFHEYQRLEVQASACQMMWSNGLSCKCQCNSAAIGQLHRCLPSTVLWITKPL